jgi:hypothetical protein
MELRRPDGIARARTPQTNVIVPHIKPRREFARRANHLPIVEIACLPPRAKIFRFTPTGKSRA